ncbi:MAG: phosphatidate cytidylyltransferase [Flavobacteriales bacterium]|nr:phosphatidate cytidylyltransferase [Flavobacteriales bacterium]
MNDLTKRIITGILFVVVLLLAITTNKYTLAGLFYIVSMAGLYEFYMLMEQVSFKPKKSAAMIVGSIIYGIIVMYSFGEFNFAYLLFIFPLLVTLVALELFRKSKDPVTNIAFSVMGILYVVIPLAILNFFAYDPTYYNEMDINTNNYSSLLLVGFFVIQWANDSGAYLFGSLLGKYKLFERISPNKTWEGFYGGAILAVITGIIFGQFFDGKTIHWIIVALIIVIFGTLGDLTESQIKRSCGVKDSGNLLPGHGGILDRFDGVLFSAPFVLAYLQLVYLQLINN